MAQDLGPVYDKCLVRKCSEFLEEVVRNTTEEYSHFIPYLLTGVVCLSVVLLYLIIAYATYIARRYFGASCGQFGFEGEHDDLEDSDNEFEDIEILEQKDCIEFAYLLFQDIFYHDIHDELDHFHAEEEEEENYEEGHWDQHRAYPTPLDFDKNKTIHRDFVIAAAALIAEVYGVEGILTDTHSFMDTLDRIQLEDRHSLAPSVHALEEIIEGGSPPGDEEEEGQEAENEDGNTGVLINKKDGGSVEKPDIVAEAGKGVRFDKTEVEEQTDPTQQEKKDSVRAKV